MSGCATVEEDLRANKPFEACVRGEDHEDEVPMLQAWIAEQAKVEVALVPRADIEKITGAPIAGYGETIGVYDVDARIPGGTLSFGLDNTGTLPSLIAHLPPLVKVARPPETADGLVVAELEPEPRGTTHESRGGSGGSVVGDILDAFIGIGTGVGIAVGAAVAVPVGIMVGMMKGIGAVLDAFAGHSSSSSSSPSPAPTPFADAVAPLASVEAPKVARVDALLTPAEREAAQRDLEAEAARYDDALAKERARRVSLASDAHAFGLDQTCANHSHCRVVVVGEAPKLATMVEATFQARDGDACTEPAGTSVEVHVKKASSALVDGASERPALASNDLDRMRASLLTMTSSLDDGAPSYALAYPTARPPPKKGTHAKESEPSPSSSLLRCEVKTKAYAKDVDGSAPDLVVRVTAGSARVRVHEAFLGPNTSTEKFAVPGLALARGDRVRLSFVSKQDQRSLGGAIETFDGSPLVFENAALRATCAEGAPDVDAVNTLELDAQHAIDAYAGSDGDRREMRDRAQAAVVLLAGELGWRDDRVRSLVAKLDAAAKATMLP